MARPSQPAGAVLRLGLALLVSVLAGVLVAGLAAPVLGGLGLAAKASADNFLALPSALDTPALATRSQVLAADGSVLATFYSVNRVEAPFAAIPPVMRQAITAIEDSRFYEHNGVDYKGTLRAAITNFKSGSTAQGGSTLTQQYVKNALLLAAKTPSEQEAARGKNTDRKLREARLALALEQKYSKDEILGRYLNIAYFGNGVYGVATAANYYYGKPVEQLTLEQAATLAGVVQNPSRYDVASKDQGVRADLKNRRDTVLGRMRDLGDITEPVRAQAAALPVDVVTPQKVGQDCGAPGVRAPFFCDYVRHEIDDTPVGAALGKTRKERQDALFGGGLTIRTSLDPRIQQAAQTAVDQQVPNGDPSGVAAVDNMVEPGTGAIRAMAVDRPYGGDRAKGQYQVNLATGGQLGVQAGSTFKAFFVANALQQGIPLSTTFYSPAKYTSPVPVCRTTRGKPNSEVSNAGEAEADTYDMRRGTADSVNTYFAQLAERTGLDAPLALAERMGVTQLGSKGPHLARVCTSYLGSATVSPLAMAGAYATFAAHGQYCPPRAVLGITGPDGKALPVPPNGCTQVVEPGIADTVTSVLTGVVTGGTGTGANIGRPVAGKTGTTDKSQAAWFVGFTPQLASSVWVGHEPNPSPMMNIRINGKPYGQLYGGTLPAAIWKQAMGAAMAPLPVQAFLPADAAVAAGGAPVPAGGGVPDVAGRSVSDATAALQAAGYTVATGRTVPSRLPAGQVVYTSPRAGRSAAPGSTVYVYRSSGTAAAAPSAAPSTPTQRSPRPARTTPSAAPTPGPTVPVPPPTPQGPATTPPRTPATAPPR